MQVVDEARRAAALQGGSDDGGSGLPCGHEADTHGDESREGKGPAELLLVAELRQPLLIGDGDGYAPPAQLVLGGRARVGGHFGVWERLAMPMCRGRFKARLGGRWG